MLHLGSSLLSRPEAVHRIRAAVASSGAEEEAGGVVAEQCPRRNSVERDFIRVQRVEDAEAVEEGVPFGGVMTGPFACSRSMASEAIAQIWRPDAREVPPHGATSPVGMQPDDAVAVGNQAVYVSHELSHAQSPAGNARGLLAEGARGSRTLAWNPLWAKLANHVALNANFSLGALRSSHDQGSGRGSVLTGATRRRSRSSTHALLIL